jgi:DNA-binding MarR family transcriptional regulator
MSGHRRKVIEKAGDLRFSLGTWQSLLKDALFSHAIPKQAGYTAFLLETYVDYGSGENARPSVETLALLQGVSERTIRGHLKALIYSGLIEKSHNHTRLRPSTYRMSMKRLLLDEIMLHEPADGEQYATQIESQPEHQRGARDYPTSYTLNTAQTSLTSNTYAFIKDEGCFDEEQIEQLIDGLCQAIEEYVNLPYAEEADYWMQAEKTLTDVLAALLDNKIDRPISYLYKILDKDGVYKYGLAVKEMWHQYVGRERSPEPLDGRSTFVAANE